MRLNGQALWRPSLARRSLGALLLSFVLVLLVLLLRDYLEVQRDFEQNLAIKVRAEAMAPIVARINDPHEAGLVVASIAEMFNTRRRTNGQFPGSVVHQLRSADGRVVMSIPPSTRQAFATAPGRILDTDIDGVAHWVVQVPAGPWLLVIAEPARTPWQMLARLGGDIVDSLLLAFPLVLLPVWLALRSGLRPLRQLAQKLGARDPHDLSPLGVVPPHAELQPLVAAFEQLLAQLRRKIALERSFVQDAAHEMRTPMAAIAAQAHVLTLTDDPAARRAAQSSLEHTLQRAAHLHRQLLDLSTLDDGQAPARQRRDVVSLVQQALASALPLATSRGLDLSLDAPERLIQELDLSAFQSVLDNLLDNALRYVPAGGRIVVSLALLPQHWSLRVADDGPGLTAPQRERAFDRFWRGHGSEAPGSGLGLAIVLRAAQRMDASVRIEDGLDGRGLAFVLTSVRRDSGAAR